ncbi:MAG: DUF3854 domain-containing protein [Nitrospira sp.]|nr:MAG: DUF3854 domain-containing protein [Nitrospira sp.]
MDQHLSLHEEQLADLRKSGLSDDTIARLGIHAVRPHDLKLPGVFHAYRLPYFDLDGKPFDFERWRLFPPIVTPDSHTRKYHQAKGSAPYLYLPPLLNWRAIAADPTITIVITEGEKKAAAGCQGSLVVMGTAGVWCWRMKLENGERLVLAELDLFVWQGRRVEILPDSDAWRPDKMIQVLAGFYALGMELTQRGAHVQLVQLPESGGIKVGLDDFLVSEPSQWQHLWPLLERWELSDRRLMKLTAWYQRWIRKQDQVALRAAGSSGERVTAIRLEPGLKPFERKRRIADLVLSSLTEKGKLICTPDRVLYFFNRQTKALVRVDQEEFLAELYEEFDLNQTEEETRFAEEQILMVARTRGDKVQVHRLAFWKEETQTLYIDMNDGTMFVLNGEEIESRDNGYDNVLFLSDRVANPIDPDFTADQENFHRLYDGLSLAGDDQAMQAQALALLKVWTLSIFFLEALPVRPILALIGEQGSGKTTLGRRLGLALYGPCFQVGSFRSDPSGEDDFIAAITARRFAVFDNADANIRWLPDHVARLATGADIEKRELYTTNRLISYRTDCMLVITSRDPRWKRDDVARRLLPIRMETIQGSKRPEKQLQGEIVNRRGAIWGSILTILNQVVASMRTTPGQSTSSHRLADFHWFGSLAAPVLGLHAEFSAAMAVLDRTQLALLGEGDERLELLTLWVTERPLMWNQYVTTTQELFQELRKIYPGSERMFPFRSTTVLGAWLGRNKELIEAQVGVVVREARSSVTRSWKFVNARCHPVMLQNPAEQQGESEADTMTPSSTKPVSDELPLDLEGKRPNEKEGKAGPELETLPQHRRAEACFSCKGIRFWESVHHLVSCTACHPPADPALVAEWIEIP